MFKITIVGKKNVGKSSLFNLLTQTNNSTTINFEGYTRDIQTEIAKINTYIYEIIDTAGIGYNYSEIESLSFKYTWRSIKYSDIIIFMIEINKEINYIEINIINTIKRIKKKII